MNHEDLPEIVIPAQKEVEVEVIIELKILTRLEELIVFQALKISKLRVTEMN